MISQIRWQRPNGDLNPLSLIHLPRFFMQWWNGRQMNEFIGKELDRRYEELMNDSYDKKSKAVIDLVLQAYLENAEPRSNRLDPDFRRFAIIQIRLFVFAGHDSTSSTICYCLYLLSKNQKALSRICSEHDAVYGKDRSSISSRLTQEPQLANDLPYTTAVIKETLRLFPPASASRQGSPGVDVVDDIGRICPTNGAVVWISHAMMHRAPKYWINPDDFLPERWLVEPGHELYPTKGAWRPFENGPRNCIAQGLVMTELRVILSLIVREFDVQDSYSEIDGNSTVGIKTYKGERAFQIDSGAAHPADFFPCKVFTRE